MKSTISFSRQVLVCTVVFLFNILPWQVYGANNKDSLINALNSHPKNDTTRVNILIGLSNIYIRSNVDSAISTADEGLSISKKLGFEGGEILSLQGLGIGYLNKNEYAKALSCYNTVLARMQKTGNKAGIARMYCYIGNVYAHMTKHGEAIDYYKKSVALSREVNNEDIEGLSLTGMGNLYTDLNDFSEALKCYLDAVKIAEHENDTDELSSCLSNIANIYASLGDYKRSLEYNKQSLDIFLKTGNKMGVVSTFANAGIVYGEIGEYRNAIASFNSGLKLADSIGDKYWKNTCLADIGEAYFKLASYDTAYEYYMLTLHIAESMNDQLNIALPENGIGSILIKKGKIAEGIKHLLIAYNIMQHAGMKIPAQEIAMNLSEAYEKAKDFPSALKYYKIYSIYSDSIYSEKSDKRVQQVQFDYELGKKENEINLLQKDKVIAESKSEKQAAIMKVSLVALAILIVASVLLYRSRSYEKRSKEQILKQHEEIQLQALKLAELNSFKDKTFSVLSHDLRGPISSFSSILSLLDDHTITADEYLKLKPEMSAQVASLTILLDNLLKWASSYMKGNIDARPASTNLHSIAVQNISLLENAARKKSIAIRNEIPADTFAWCDKEQMDIVIRNLLMEQYRSPRLMMAIRH